jgi:3-oxoacyl-[acyl-carrier-protein] synthase III
MGTDNQIPRRCRIDLNTPAELAIRAAMEAVEMAGADPLLTDAVILLDQAREKVADFVDCTRAPQQEQP